TLMGIAIDADTRAPVLDAGGGGFSGAPIKPIALRAVSDVAREFPHVPIIGTGGGSTRRDPGEMVLAGAPPVGGGTATLADPRAPLRIAQELAAWCATHDVRRAQDLTRGCAF